MAGHTIMGMESTTAYELHELYHTLKIIAVLKLTYSVDKIKHDWPKA